jgi:hypothetical protein
VADGDFETLHVIRVGVGSIPVKWKTDLFMVFAGVPGWFNFEK